MVNVTAKEALGYALDREMIYLYATLAVGFIVTWFGIKTIADFHGPLAPVLLKNSVAVIITVAGMLLQVGGFTGILYKVISDATQ